MKADDISLSLSLSLSLSNSSLRFMHNILKEDLSIIKHTHQDGSMAMIPLCDNGIVS